MLRSFIKYIVVFPLFFGIVAADADAERYTTSTGYRTSSVFKNGLDNSWSFSKSFMKTSFGSDIGGWRVNVNLAYEEPGGYLRWGDKTIKSEPVSYNNQLTGEIYFEERALTSEIIFGNENESLKSTAGWKNRIDHFDDYYASIRWKPINHISLSLKTSIENPLPAYSELYYRYLDSSDKLAREGGRISWRAPLTAHEIILEISPGMGFFVKSQIKESRFDPEEPANDINSGDGYLGLLQGIFNNGELVLGYNIDDNSKASLRFQSLKLESSLHAYYDRTQFAQFGILKGEADIWNLEYEKKDFKARLSGGEANGEFKGVVEAWPFLDGLVKFLGERRHFIGEIKLDWTQLNLTKPLVKFKNHRLITSLDFYRLYPELRTVNWRPLIFGFGIDDLQRDELNLKRADMLNISLNPQFGWKRFLLDISISQWVPLRIKKDDNSTDAESSDNGSDYSTISDDKVTGGFSFSVSLITGI